MRGRVCQELRVDCSWVRSPIRVEQGKGRDAVGVAGLAERGDPGGTGSLHPGAAEQRPEASTARCMKSRP
jgi:hypothetical protein